MLSMRLKHGQWISKDSTHLWPSSDYFPDGVDASSTANSCRVCSITLGVQVEMAAQRLRKSAAQGHVPAQAKELHLVQATKATSLPLPQKCKGHHTFSISHSATIWLYY